MHIFHKWGKWEQYKWVGKMARTGFLVPTALQGKWFDVEEKRQRRTCEICGKLQDEEI